MKSVEPLKKEVLRIQKKEITHYYIYKYLSITADNDHNKSVLQNAASGEMSHYEYWKTVTNKNIKPRKIKIFFYICMAKVLGLSFALKLMEREKNLKEEDYDYFKHSDAAFEKIIRTGEAKERDILKLIDEEKMHYTDSIILGLNDGLVELIGGLAGFTLSLQDTKIIAIAGLIMGIAGSISMAGAEFLSTKDKGDKSPVKASFYTGISYFIMVLLLIFPFLFFPNPFVDLAISVFTVIVVIAVFNFYIAIAKDISFLKRFIPMLTIGMGAAGINFIIGLIVRNTILG